MWCTWNEIVSLGGEEEENARIVAYLSVLLWNKVVRSVVNGTY